MNPVECIEGYVSKNEIAGAALRVRKNGRVVCEATPGVADISTNAPVTKDTVFRLASMTKPILGIATLKMVEQGLLNIEDTVETYIPAYKDMLVAKSPANDNPYGKPPEGGPMAGLTLEAAERPLTLGMLLNHSSGMASGPVGMYLFGLLKEFESLERRVNHLGHLPLDFQPGTGASYSAGAAFDTLGRILEIVSGKDLESLLREIIFSPLGINDIGFTLNTEQQARTARVYEYAEGKLRDSTDDGDIMLLLANAMKYGYFCGSGGLCSSLDAFDRIAQMLANGGEVAGVRILSPDSVKRLATPCSPKQPMPGLDWGLSVAVFEGRDKGRWLSRGSFGWSGGLGTHFYVDPLNKISVVLLLNRSNVAGALSHISLAIEEAVYKTYIDPDA
jgi:CubicO group peptidase (beta-lactamase class C family)